MDSNGEEVKGKCKPFFNKTLRKQFTDTDFKECKPCPKKGGAPEHLLVEVEDGHQEPGMEEPAEKNEDFHWSAWGKWGKCSAKCGPEGTRKRHRKCMDSNGEEVKGKCKPFFNKTLRKQFTDTDFKECKPCPKKGLSCSNWWLNGKTYKDGESMPCDNIKCNYAKCMNGEWGPCTERGCPTRSNMDN